MTPAPLDRKLLRDLWRTRWQVMAIALLIACGVSVAVMSFSAQQALARAQADFYRETRFADVFAQAKRAPLSRVRDLSAIAGVTAVDARIVESGLMDVPGLARPAIAQLISLPDDPERGLNRARLIRGRMPAPGQAGEAVALNGFLDAAHVRLGDRLTATFDGRAATFTIVGAVLSPEYVYVPAPESFMPDDAHQAILWAPRAAVERAAGLSGAFNAVSMTLAAEDGRGLAREAQAMALTPNAWAAALVRNRLHGKPAFARRDEAALIAVQAEFRRIGINVNQIARALNTAVLAGEVLDLELAYLADLRTELRAHMSTLRAAFEGNLSYWSAEL